MVSPQEVSALLRAAEPTYASGTYIEASRGRTDRATVFAYRRGGAWALISSGQGMRVTDAHTLWSCDHGSQRVSEVAPPGYHSGALRDMLIPRWRPIFHEHSPLRLDSDIGPVRALDRPAHRVRVVGDARCNSWTMDVDAAEGLVLAERVVWHDGSDFSRGFVALHVGTPLPDELFEWRPLAGE